MSILVLVIMNLMSFCMVLNFSDQLIVTSYNTYLQNFVVEHGDGYCYCRNDDRSNVDVFNVFKYSIYGLKWEKTEVKENPKDNDLKYQDLVDMYLE